MSELIRPSRRQARRWFRRLTPKYVHHQGWSEVNERQHALAMEARVFGRDFYSNAPAETRAFMDGFTLGVLSLLHFADIQNLEQLWQDQPQTDIAQKSTE